MLFINSEIFFALLSFINIRLNHFETSFNGSIRLLIKITELCYIIVNYITCKNDHYT